MIILISYWASCVQCHQLSPTSSSLSTGLKLSDKWHPKLFFWITVSGVNLTGGIMKGSMQVNILQKTLEKRRVSRCVKKNIKRLQNYTWVNALYTAEEQIPQRHEKAPLEMNVSCTMVTLTKPSDSKCVLVLIWYKSAYSRKMKTNSNSIST